MTTRIGSPDLLALVPASAHGRIRIRLEPAGSGTGMLDGGWWPYTADPAEELPGLLLAIEHIHGPVCAVLLNAGLWHPHREHTDACGRTVDVSYFASQPASLVTARCEGGGRVDLLVVAPRRPSDYAARAMLLAAQTGDRVTAAYLSPEKVAARVD